MQKLLIADDNKQITDILKHYATDEGFEVLIAYDGRKAFELFEQSNPDIILLDVMMPEMDGFEVCRKIRKVSGVPIIMITARGEDFEKIMGLDIGADDYIVKPFSPGEVMARVRAILRRMTTTDDTETSDSISCADLTVDIDNYSVSIRGEKVSLTKKEIEILWTLVKTPSKVFTRENLLDSIWGYDYYGDIRTVDTHIKRLRAKLNRYEHDLWDIETVWGVGYKFEVASE